MTDETGLWAVALHGGAGPTRDRDYREAEAHMAETLRQAEEALKAGAAALDVVTDAVKAFEDSGLHVAGRGSSPNRNGVYELDASIMDGPSRKAGAVACLVGFQSPIEAARKVMEETKNVFLAGDGAAEFAAKYGLAEVSDPDQYYQPSASKLTTEDDLSHGTVGAVALDTSGAVAAATSTGGILNKRPGRVGDTPVIGAGTWADERVAVSSTGLGEYFLRANVAADVSARVKYGQMSLEDAAKEALIDMARLGGDGGLIAVDVLGNVTTPYNSEGMKRGIADWRGRFEVKTFA